MTLQLLILFIATAQYSDPNVVPVWDQLNTLKRISDQWGYPGIRSVWYDEDNSWFFVDDPNNIVGMEVYGRFAKGYRGGLTWPVEPRPDLYAGIIKRLLELLALDKPNGTRYRGNIKVEFDFVID